MRTDINLLFIIAASKTSGTQRLRCEIPNHWVKKYKPANYGPGITNDNVIDFS